MTDFLQKTAPVESFPVESSREKDTTFPLCFGSRPKAPDLNACLLSLGIANGPLRGNFESPASFASAWNVSPSQGGSAQLDPIASMNMFKKQAILAEFLTAQEVISQQRPQSTSILDQATWPFQLGSSSVNAVQSNLDYLISSLVNTDGVKADGSRDILSQLLTISLGVHLLNKPPQTQGLNNECNTIRLLNTVAQARGKLSLDDLAFLVHQGK